MHGLLSKGTKGTSRVIAVAITSLILVALAGTAIAVGVTDNVQDRRVTKKLVRKLAPKLTVKSANSANTATNAQTADTAANAQKLGGLPPSAFLAGTLINTGLVKLGAGQTQPIITSGPFTITAACTIPSAGDRELDLTATSTEAGSALDGREGTTATFDSAGPSSTFVHQVNENADFEAPSGATLDGLFEYGVVGLGADCWVSVVGFHN